MSGKNAVKPAQPVPLARGREFLSIPGPTNVPEVVLQAMHRPAVDIYADELLETTGQCLADMKKVFRTEGDSYLYIGNGHGGWEAALTNTLSRGDRVLVLESGRFAKGWGEQGDMLGLTVEILPGSWRHAVDPAAVAARLKADTRHEIKAIMVVQIDTASGVVNDIPAIRAAIDAARHPVYGRRHRLGRLHGIRDGRVEDRRLRHVLAKGHDDDAGPRVCRGLAQGQSGAPEVQSSHCLLGLDRARFS